MPCHADVTAAAFCRYAADVSILPRAAAFRRRRFSAATYADTLPPLMLPYYARAASDADARCR